MLKAAVIGVGSIGQNHARLYAGMDGVKLVGVVDPDEAQAGRIGTRYNVPFYRDIAALFDAQKPDLVTVAVPTIHHFTVGMDALQRGAHVLMEKPITSTIEQAEQLIERAHKAGLLLAVGHVERFNPAVTELRRRLREGIAGRVYKVLAQRLSPYPPRIKDAGVVIDLASHDIDLLRFLTEDPIVRLYGETLRTISSDREDAFNGLVRFKSGAIGVLDVNWITPTKVRRLTVTGARGLFECDLLSQELFFYENESAPSQWDMLSVLRGVTEGNVLGIRIARKEPLNEEISDFVDAVRRGRAPVVTGEEGLETLRVALHFLRSGADGSVIRLQEDV